MASYNPNKSEKRKIENNAFSSNGEVEIVQKRFKSNQNEFEVITNEYGLQNFIIEDEHTLDVYEQQLELEHQRSIQHFQWQYDNIIKIIHENEFLEDYLKTNWINFINENVGNFLLNIQKLRCRVSQITSYTINATAFMSLAIEHHWLEDNILDLVIGLKCKDSKVQYIETSVTDLIKFGDRSILPRFQEDKDLAMAVFNYNGNHWVFFMLHKPTRCLFVVDPMENADVERNVATILFQCFAQVRHGASDESRKKSDSREWNFEDCDWSTHTIRHTKQNDGANCGVFCIEFAINIINSYPDIPDYLHVDQDFNKLRRKYAATLLRNAEAL